MERLLDRNRPSYRHVVATKKKIQPILETDVDDSAVAERVKISLEGCDMTTREVADAVGVGEKVIYSWGRLGQISKHKLPAFCQVTNVDIDWLLTGRTSGMTYERTANESIVEFRRSRGVGEPEFGVRDIPIVDTLDLYRLLPKKETSDNFADVGDIIKQWLADPTERGSIPVPILDTENALAIPSYGLQVSTTEYSAFDLGDIICMATDVFPDRDDFVCVAFRRAGIWMMTAGFLQFDQRIYTEKSMEFWQSAKENDTGISMNIRRSVQHSTDTTQIKLFGDEWLIVGVGVARFGWLNPSQRLSQTRLSERLRRRLERRSNRN